MRTIVDIPEASLKWLASYCKSESISRAEAIRRAVVAYQEKQLPSEAEKRAEDERILNETFGAWKNSPEWQGRDSVEYVRSIRDEWEDPWENR